MAEDGDEDGGEEVGETTHVAWALQRRRKGRTIYTVPLKIGTGRIDPDGTPRLFQDREPKGGYGGYIAEIVLLPRGVIPRTKTAPRRPEHTSDRSEGNSDGD
jgi:hypothetical protein